jgi:hypothetical protein
LASEVLAATGALALLALLYPRQVRARAVYAGKALGTAAVVELVLVAWPLWVQFLGPEHPHTPIQRPGVAVTDLANFVVPTGLQRFTSSAAVALSDHFTSNGTEWNGYIGLPPLLLLGGVTARWWQRPPSGSPACSPWAWRSPRSGRGCTSPGTSPGSVCRGGPSKLSR